LPRLKCFFVTQTVLVQSSPDNDYTRMLFTACFETDISKPALVFIETTLPIFFFSYNSWNNPQIATYHATV
jgi:hypothetical protein